MSGERSPYRRGIGFGALSFATMVVLGAVSSFVTARVYGVHAVGQFALASAPATALWFLSSVKEQVALIRELTELPARAPRVTGLFAAVFTFSTAFTLFVATVAGVITYFVFRGPLHHPELFRPALGCLAAYSLVTNVGWNFDSIFSAFVAGRQLFWIRLHELGLSLVIAIVAGLAGAGVWGLILGTYGGSLTALIHRVIAAREFMVFRVSRSELRNGFRSLPDLLRFAIRMAPGAVFTGTSTQCVTWILGTLAPISTVGAFNRAQMLANRFQQLNTRIVEMLFPTLVERDAKNDRAGFDRAFVDTMRYSTVVMVAISSIGGGTAVALMRLFGPGFTQAADAFAIVLWMPAATTVGVIQTHALYAVGRPVVTSVSAGVRALVTVVVCYVATKQFGIIGPAIALLLGATIDVLIKGVAIRGHLSASLLSLWSLRQMLALMLAYGAGFAAARAVCDAFPHLLGLPAAGAVSALVYVVTFILAGGLVERDRQRLGPASTRLRARFAGT